MLKVLELFSGIGACSKALERLGIEHKIVDAVEIDKYAITSFNAIHGTDFDVQDITEWDKDIECDLIMHGSPCQDFSVAGKQAGGDVGSGTRSSLMYETIRIVGKLRPKYVVWENVKNLLSKKHKHNFDAYIETMNILGYNSYYQVLNAKDYGIPQNRERVFTISIRKDVDSGCFNFPEKEELKLRLKDMLEEQVDEKYYLSDKMMNYVLKPGTKGYMKEPELNNEIAKPLLATMTKMHRAGIDNYIAEPKCEQVGTLDIKGQDIIKRVYSDNGLSPTLTNMQGGNRQPKILEDFYKNRPVREYEEVAPTLRSERIGLKVVEPQLITHNIQQTVKVRKYPVNVESLKSVLRDAKLNADLNNKQIAEILDIPQTQVEHYFRTDNSFAIPSPEIWLKLKEILGIIIDEFDESIMTFEEKEGIYEKANRVYDEQGLAPTLTQQEEKILVKNATKKGYDEAIDGDSINLSYPESTTRRGRVGHGVSQTLQCNDSMGVVEAEIKVLGNYMPSNHDASRIVDSGGLAPTVKENHGTVTATVVGEKEYERTPLKFLNRNQKNIDGDYAFCVDSCNTGGVKEINGSNLRIRKLTPKECWRLMGFDDSDFEKAKNTLNEKFYKGKDKSSSQLYKQAGNSIVVNVLEKIFKNLLEG